MLRRLNLTIVSIPGPHEVPCRLSLLPSHHQIPHQGLAPKRLWGKKNHSKIYELVISLYRVLQAFLNKPFTGKLVFLSSNFGGIEEILASFFPIPIPYILLFTQLTTSFMTFQNGDLCISILHPPIDDPQSGELPCERWNPTQNVRWEREKKYFIITRLRRSCVSVAHQCHDFFFFTVVLV